MELPLLQRIQSKNTQENTPIDEGGGIAFSSQDIAVGIATGSNLNGTTANSSNDNADALATASGSTNNRRGQHKQKRNHKQQTSANLDQLASDAGVDATIFQSLVTLITDACGTTEEIVAGDRTSLKVATEKATVLVNMGVRTVEAMKALIKACAEENSWRKTGLTPQLLTDYHSKKQQEIKAKAAATDPNENPMIWVEQLLLDLDGKPEWVETQMRRKRFERELAKGANVRLPQVLAAD